MKEQKEEWERELQELSPLLAQWKAENRLEGFETPPAYFRRLPDEVLRRMAGEQEAANPAGWPARWLSSLRGLLQPRYAIGLATIAVLVIAGLAYWRTSSSAEANPFAGLSTEEITTYIDANLEKFDEELVIEATMSASGLTILPPSVASEDSLDEDYLRELLRDMDDETLQELL